MANPQVSASHRSACTVKSDRLFATNLVLTLPSCSKMGEDHGNSHLLFVLSPQLVGQHILSLTTFKLALFDFCPAGHDTITCTRLLPIWQL